MILSPEVYNKITAVVFTRQEPTVTTVFWARPSNPEGTGFDFFVFDNGSWQSLSQYDNVIIPEVDPYLSAFINDVGFYSVPTGGIPSTDLSEAVQTALSAASSAYQKPSSGIPATDLADGVIPDVSRKADKVQSATNGHLAGLDSNGNLTDSNISASNVVTKSSTSGLLKNDGTVDTTQYATTSDLSDYIAKSNTTGLVKNDGTIDQSTYATQTWVGQQGYVTDITGKEDKVTIESASGATLTAEVGKYYTLSNVGTLAITLPTIASGTTTLQTVTFYVSAGSSPAVTFTSTHSIYYSDGFEIAANSTYEVSAAYNGIAWVVASVKIVIPT